MSEITLYNTLRKIPDVSDAEAKEAVAHVASSKDVATKIDITELKAETKADIAGVKSDIREIRTELKYLQWLIIIVVSIAVGVIKYL